MQKFNIQPEFTNHCNYRCIFCPHSVYCIETAGGNIFNRKKGFMSDDLFNIVLENANKYAKGICIGFFGEQLLHPNFDEYIEAFPVKRSYPLHINTNWSLVTEEKMETLKHFDLVRISLDASSSALYEKLRSGGPVLDLNGKPSKDRYETIVEKVEYWLGLSGHAPTRLVYVVSSFNEHDRMNFIREWQPKLGPRDHILTKSVISYGGVMKDSHMKENPCEVEKQRWFTIAWNGDCSPCNIDVNIALKVGNLLEARDMKRIIEGEKWKRVMSGIRRKKGICSNCFDANNWTESKCYWG